MNNIDIMLSSIINKDNEGFSSAFSDEMKERLATSIIDKDLNIAKDILFDESDEEEIDSEEQEEIEEGGKDVVKKGKPIAMDLLYPKGHPRAGEIVGGKKKTKPEESEKIKRYKAKWNTRNMKRDAVRTGMEGTKTESVELDEGYTFKSPRDVKEFIVALIHMGVKKNNISQKGKTVSVRGLRDKNTLRMIKTMAKDMKASIKEDNNIINAIKEAYESESGIIYTLKDSYDIHILPKDADNIIQIHDSLNKDNQVILRDMLSENENSFYKVLNFCTNKASKEQ